MKTTELMGRMLYFEYQIAWEHENNTVWTAEQDDFDNLNKTMQKVWIRFAQTTDFEPSDKLQSEYENWQAAKQMAAVL